MLTTLTAVLDIVERGSKTPGPIEPDASVEYEMDHEGEEEDQTSDSFKGVTSLRSRFETPKKTEKGSSSSSSSCNYPDLVPRDERVVPTVCEGKKEEDRSVVARLESVFLLSLIVVTIIFLYQFPQREYFEEESN